MAEPVVAVVVSKLVEELIHYAQSKSKLVRGVEKKICDLSDALKRIKTVLYDAERRRYKDKNVHNWILLLEDTSHEMEDVLEEWRYCVLDLERKGDRANVAASTAFKDKVHSIILPSCLCVKKSIIAYDIGRKVEVVAAKLEEVVKKKDEFNFVMMSEPTTYTTSWRISISGIDTQRVHGRVLDKNMIVSKVKRSGFGVVSIVGVGGLGKTTLAQLVYNDTAVKDYFDSRIWVRVSDHFDLVKTVKLIIKSIKGSSQFGDELDDQSALVERLAKLLSGKNFFLVLDDVWTEEYKTWESLKYALKHGGADSKVLITTRNERVAKIMGTPDDGMYRLGLLSDYDCWLLLRDMALWGRDESRFEDVGRRIAKKCNGLPLAAITLGSLLQFKNSEDEWEDVLQNELWELVQVQEELFRHLLLTYYELTPMQRYCFSYCASFPKDEVIWVEEVIQRWMAQGYLGSSGENLEAKGYEYFKILAMRSLFQDFEKDSNDQIKNFKMHDTVHDFADFLRMGSRDEASEMKKHCHECDPALVSTVAAYRTLIVDQGALEISACDCLTSVRVLRGRNNMMNCMPKLIHLRWLCMDHTALSNEDLKIICKLYYLQTLSLSSCGVEEIPREMGYLVELRHLDLSRNMELKELPDSITNLLDLHTLCVDYCSSLHALPQGMHTLKHLRNACTDALKEIPELAGLCTLAEFHAARTNMGCLKNCNNLTFLLLKIGSADDDLDQVIQNAREAQLKSKKHLRTLTIQFFSSSSGAILDVLEPHLGVKDLTIAGYNGSRFPNWISSPLSQLKSISLQFCNTPSLPPLGKLPYLEVVDVSGMDGLQCLGREFLGIQCATEASSSTNNAVAVVFPKLKQMSIINCDNWSKWEDITSEEADSPAFSIMPCLSILSIRGCRQLEALPHHLLLKAAALEDLYLDSSEQLVQRYGDIETSPLKSIHIHNPTLRLFL